jgi:hypothetical protein
MKAALAIAVAFSALVGASAQAAETIKVTFHVSGVV